MSQIVTTTWKENMVLESDNPHGNHVLMETEPNFGGTNAGLNPKALMLSSIGGCTGLDVLSLFKKMRVEVEDIKIIVEGELTDEHPKYYHKIHLTYSLKTKSEYHEKVKKAVTLSQDRYCGISYMLSKSSELTHEIDFQEL